MNKMLIHNLIKKIKFILLIIIIIIINITDFLSVSDQSYCNDKIDLHSKMSSLERERNINHKYIIKNNILIEKKHLNSVKNKTIMNNNLIIENKHIDSVKNKTIMNNNLIIENIDNVNKKTMRNHHIKKKEEISHHVKQINLSLKKRIYHLFFFQKKQFIIMNHTLLLIKTEAAEAEYLFQTKNYKKALLNFKNIIQKFSFKKEFYNIFIKKIALCYFFLKKYDLAINFFKSLLKDNTDNSAEENIFYLGMCYYLQSNDYFFFQKNRMKYIKIFLFLRKNYPNSIYLPKVDKIIYNAFLTLKKKKESIGMYYFNTKKYNSSRRVFKQIINDYKDIFNIQKEYIYMIISQYKVEKENKNSSFEETMILHNTYMQVFLENNSHFIYEMNLSLPSKIKKQFQKIEIHLILIKKMTQYLLENNL